MSRMSGVQQKGCVTRQAPVRLHHCVVRPVCRTALTCCHAVKQQLDTAERHAAPLESPTVAGVLLDIDGVVCCGQQAVPGAAAAVHHLRACRVPYKFVTNTTTDKREGIAARLLRSGIPCEPCDIISPAVCAALYLQQNNLGPVALFVSPEVLPDFAGCQLLPPSAVSGAAAVVVGDMGPGWTYDTLNRAFRLMMDDPRPQLLSLGKSRYYKDSDGLSLDVGPFTAALEFATGCPAVVLGKPSAGVFQLAASSLGLSPCQVVMVGDDVLGDVGGAQGAGCQGVLVCTGKYREGDERGPVTPHAVLPSLAALPDWLADRLQQQQQVQEQEQQQQEQQL